MIRVTASGDVSDVERKEVNNKAVVNFRINDSGLSLRASAWGDMAALVPESGRVLIEGSMKGRQYEVDGQKRTSQDVTCSVVEPLGAATAEDDGDLFS